MTFKKTVLDRSNEQNLKLVKKAQFKVEKKRCRVIVRHMTRWDNFRERRIKIMDKYIFWRRRQAICEFYITMMKIRRIVLTADVNFAARLLHYDQLFKA